MKEFNDKGSGTAIMYHPETDDEYEISCYWTYCQAPASYWEPGYTEFITRDHELESINGEKTNEPVPDWVDWDDYDEKIFNKVL